MSTHSDDGRVWPAPLAGRLPRGAGAGRIADAVAAVWQEIDEALHPVIGHRGVAALFHRSITLTSRAHPWMAAGHPGLLARVDTSALKSALANQAPASASAAGITLFDTLRDLLATLVGPSLTERLLLPVWVHSSADSPPQDPPWTPR